MAKASGNESSYHGIRVTAVYVSGAAARSVLTSAFEAGAHGSAWAGVHRFQRTKQKGLITWVQISNNEDATQQWSMDRRPYYGKVVVAVPDICAGVRRILRDPGRAGVGMAAVGRLLAMELDGPLADQVVQVSCFRRVIYG